MVAKNARVLLIALFCLVLAQENLAGDPTEHLEEYEANDPLTQAPPVFKRNEEFEVSQLTPETIKFRQFCLDSEEKVLKDIGGQPTMLEKLWFYSFKNSAMDMGADDIQVYLEAARLLATQEQSNISEAGNPIVHAIHSEGAGKIVFDRYLIGLNAVRTDATYDLVDKLEIYKTKRSDTPEKLLPSVLEGCKLVVRSIDTIFHMFNSAKRKILRTDQSVASINVQDVQCMTSSGVLKSKAFCLLLDQVVELASRN